MQENLPLIGPVIMDGIIFATCATLLLLKGRLSHSHPATMYLIFHAFVVSFRSWNILAGQPTLFSDWPNNQYDGVTIEEIIRGIFVFDLALVLMTLGWFLAQDHDRLAHAEGAGSATKIYALWLPHLRNVAIVSILIGIPWLIIFRNVGADLSDLQGQPTASGAWEKSFWLVMPKSWAGLGLLCLIFAYGLRPGLMIPLSIYLLYMAIQGGSRFRVILPIIMLCMIYLDRKHLRWPRMPTIIVLLVFGLAFFPLKSIGRAIRDGKDIASILDISRDTFADIQSGKHGDSNMLDTVAATLTLVDDHNSLFLGKTYLSVITLPIPRLLWPEKPGLADWLHDISTPSRPIDKCGMASTVLCESYANFGYIGILVIPPLLAYGTGRAYFRAYRAPYFSVSRFFYYVLACNLIQIYRDGLTSIVVFTLFQMTPMMAIVVLHLLFPNYRIIPGSPSRPQSGENARPPGQRGVLDMSKRDSLVL